MASSAQSLSRNAFRVHFALLTGMQCAAQDGCTSCQRHCLVIPMLAVAFMGMLRFDYLNIFDRPLVQMLEVKVSGY